ncbi:MAG: element excision factor XisH family protein [Bacteroidota bacterium]
MARDLIHYIVKRALQKLGWDITDDPLVLLPGEDDVSVDLGAEKLIRASKNKERIAVEVKSFSRPSIIYEFHQALGQYYNYETALMISEKDSDRQIYAAMPVEVYDALMQSKMAKSSIARLNMHIILVDLETETIVRWIK